MKIQLLSPAGEIHRNTTGIFKTALRYAPLTLTTLAALVPPELNAEITIQDEGVQPLDLDFPPSLVGITAITGTCPPGLRDCRPAASPGPYGRHRRCPSRPCCPTRRPSMRMRSSSSYAENSWPQLLRDFAGGRLKPRYLAPTGRGLEGVPMRAPRPAQEESLRAPSTASRRRAAVRTSATSARCRPPGPTSTPTGPIEEVIAELRTFEGRHALFIDLSPVEDVAYAKALYRAMIPLRMRWVGLATTRIAEDDELLKLAAAERVPRAC